MHLPPFGVIWMKVASTVTIASIVCNVLPKSTVFNGYPRIKKAYETGINFVILFALNIRACLPSLDVHIPGLGFTPPQSREVSATQSDPK